MKTSMLRLLIIAAIVSSLVRPGPATAESPQSEPMPIRYAVETINGETVDIEHWRGSWVVVNFWATWCKPCRKEMPEFEELYIERADVEFLGLAMEDTGPQAIQEFLTKVPVTYPLAIVDVYEPPTEFGTPRVLPTTVVIDPNGVAKKTFHGPVTRHQLEEAMVLDDDQ